VLYAELATARFPTEEDVIAEIKRRKLDKVLELTATRLPDADRDKPEDKPA
jgi:hypothetical protein